MKKLLLPLLTLCAPFYVYASDDFVHPPAGLFNVLKFGGVLLLIGLVVKSSENKKMSEAGDVLMVVGGIIAGVSIAISVLSSAINLAIAAIPLVIIIAVIVFVVRLFSKK